jgi:hypothetical protein
MQQTFSVVGGSIAMLIIGENMLTSEKIADYNRYRYNTYRGEISKCAIIQEVGNRAAVIVAGECH